MTLTGIERFFDTKDMIVSKTDVKGYITYANDIFLDIAGYAEEEVLNKPHNLIRHPDMPRCVFKLLWDTLAGGNEIFAYVLNQAKNGDYYWVLAHVTPSYDADHNVIGYHSTRRVPNPDTVQNAIIPLYNQLCEIENSEQNSKVGMQKAFDHLVGILTDAGIDYDEFISSLMHSA
ncbi:MAG: PAS domain-containing protein [Magnetovibrio sp.]|nr:PAS domain-containing protein [Magnetovibrio sp.]